MRNDSISWGVVSTIKAQARDVLDFAAYYLDVGASRLFLYLDSPCPDALPHLKMHPEIQVIECDEAYWRQHGFRPVKHQVRQTINATHAYQQQAKGVDWLLHCDSDEFLWSQRPIYIHLAALPTDALCARVHSLEALSGGDGSAFKKPLEQARPDAKIADVYPEYGSLLRGGFLSHTQGKLFIRTGLPDLEFRIHNAVQNGITIPDDTTLVEMDLCHFHAYSWHSWLALFPYRLQHGSYRPSLKPAQPREVGGVTAHELLAAIHAEQGETGLRSFFREVCEDSPNLRARLSAADLLEIRQLALDAKRRKHFPDFG